MTVRYPVPGLTPHGYYHLVEGQIPMVWLESYDGTVIFDLMGGRNIVDRRAPESVQLARDGLKGLIPPWRSIDQKGASQDGVTFIDSLYDPAEVALTVVATARDRVHLRQVIRDLIASLDTKQTAKLHFWSHQLGHWWAPLRWFKTPPDANSIAAKRRHRMTLITRSDDAFWQTYPSTDLWAPSYEAMSDPFNYTDAGSIDDTQLGANWPLFYYDIGGGYLSTDGSKARWIDQHGWRAGDRAVVCGPYKDFATDTDFQVVTMQTGNTPEVSLPQSATNDLWARMGRNIDGTWNGYGVRCRFGPNGIHLDRFNGFRTAATSSGAGAVSHGWYSVAGLNPADWPAGEPIQFFSDTGTVDGHWFNTRHAFGTVQIYNDLDGITWDGSETVRGLKKTVMGKKLVIAPLRLKGEKWTLIAGVESDPRQFVVMRNDVEAFHHKESGEGSAVGANYRGVGWGMGAFDALIRQATPSTVKKVTAADNVAADQDGYVHLTNVGDQPMSYSFTVFGPGTFKFWLPEGGPEDFVEFGPLLPRQVAQINTDIRKRSVQDLTSEPPTPQELTAWQKSIDKMLGFGGNDALPLIQQIKSMWGILPPQGDLYSLLKGRWSDTSAVPPKPAGSSAQPFPIKVGVAGGSAMSKVIASGTPKRRYPL